MEKQILPGMAGDMATYIYKGIVCGGSRALDAVLEQGNRIE
jgi:hypothetical protein